MKSKDPDHAIRWTETSMVAYQASCCCCGFEGKFRLSREQAVKDYNQHIVLECTEKKESGETGN